MNAVVEWAANSRALAGEPISGDLHLVALFEGGALAAVIDGLGHGPEAAAAAMAAAAVLSLRPEAPIAELMQLCHEELRRTRGAVLSLASFDAARGVVTWAGVGDVEGVLLRAGERSTGGRQTIMLRNGVVGYQMQPPRTAVWPVATGDILIFATDGVRHGFTTTVAGDRTLQKVADDIIADYGRSTDDALALVVRYLGRHQGTSS